MYFENEKSPVQMQDTGIPQHKGGLNNYVKCLEMSSVACSHVSGCVGEPLTVLES